MNVLLGVLGLVLHAGLVAVAAPVLAGLLDWGRARLLGHQGPPLLQPVRDLLRLLRKAPVGPDGASVVFAAAPAAALGTVAAAALLVPSFTLGMATASLADLLVVAGLLAASRMAMAMGGLDTGTAPGGTGAGRIALVAVFSAPAVLLVAFVLVLLAGTSNLDAAAALLRDGQAGPRVSLAMAAAALALVALAEGGRVPVDDASAAPGAVQFAAWGQGATALDYAGRSLALAEYASFLRLLTWLDLLATVFLPFGLAAEGAGPLAWATGLLAWGAKLLGLAAGIVLLESGTARLRAARVPEFLGVAILLGLLAVILLFVGQGFA